MAESHGLKLRFGDRRTRLLDLAAVLKPIKAEALTGGREKRGSALTDPARKRRLEFFHEGAAALGPYRAPTPTASPTDYFSSTRKTFTFGSIGDGT